ncbi:MAG: Smr/MutS family protein [Hyphomicrobium sp.]
MKKPARGGFGPRRPPSQRDDDRLLWELTKETIEPLRRKSRVHTALSADAPVPARKLPKPERAEPARRVSSPTAPAVVVPPAAPSPPLAAFDQRKAKKLRAGRIEIERRIDLHGMRQGEAHAALRRFLFDCVGQGRRWVLVITGKGAPRRKKDDDHDAPWSEREPGVLKRLVPQWLADPELRTVVVSYRSAAVQHGGEGALYVHLRRQDRFR